MQARIENALQTLVLVFLTAGFCFGDDVTENAVDVENVDVTSETAETYTWTKASDFLQSFCADCHQGDDAEADLDLDTFATLMSLEDHPNDWRKLLSHVRDHQMPPKESEQPTLLQREQFTSWLRATLLQAACGAGIRPAPAVTRRLNRDEYANTIRDLLDIHVNVALTLPADGAGGEGFDNAAETLFISPIHAEKYLDCAQTALEHALKDERARNKLLPFTWNESASTNETSEETSDEKTSRAVDAAQQALATFLPRAFRRPIADDELTAYVDIFRTSYEIEASFQQAIKSTMSAALISPHFLFRVEKNVDGDAGASANAVPLDDFELASRLSYFLWGSMPDEELLRVAGEGKLQNDDELQRQVKRMLAGGEVGRDSNKVSGFAQSFIEQWLGTRALGREFKPDPKVAKRYSSELEGGMKYEPVLFFEEILVNDLSILNCIDADFTFANRSLAKHYGIKGEFREQPRRVELDDKNHRGGFLGMASVLAISSYPHRTSPVLRGKWILETLLGTPPAPPPPNVPELNEVESIEKPTTLRERLEAHRERPECAVCHDRIDPLGFGLANYDVLGKYRYLDSGKLINSRGKLPDGTEFHGPRELKQALLARKDQFAEHMTSKLLGFALSRGLRDEDRCAVQQIVEELRHSNYSSHTLIWGIVRSVPFRMKSATKRP